MMLSMLSLVVPSTSSTIALSSFIIVLNKVDLPVFGLPRIQMPGGGMASLLSCSPVYDGKFTNFETTSSRRSPIFIPFNAEILIGYPNQILNILPYRNSH